MRTAPSSFLRIVVSSRLHFGCDDKMYVLGANPKAWYRASR